MDDRTTETTVMPATGGHRRRIAAAAVLGLLALGGGALAVGGTGGDGESRQSETAAVPGTTTLLEPAIALVDLPVAAGAKPSAKPSAPADQPPTDEPPTEQPPVEQPPAEQPPAQEPPAEEPPAEQPPAADPGVLAVDKHKIELPANTWVGSFQVRNDGGSALDWQWAAGAAGITVSQSSGTLQPGEFVEVSFAVNPTVLPKGDFLFANLVSSGDQVKDVRVEGTKTIAKNPGIELPDPVIKANA